MNNITFGDNINKGLLLLMSYENTDLLERARGTGCIVESCTCNAGNAPCGWCESITEHESEILDYYGMQAVNYIRYIKGEW